MAKNRPGTILYALGMTQHTTGVQGIRGFTILQLLLGNLGKPGSGVNALRGEPNVQGACDMGVLNNYLPGYMDYPSATEPTLEAYTKKNGTGTAGSSSTCSRPSTATRPRPRTTSATAGCPRRPPGRTTAPCRSSRSALAGKMKMLWIVGQNPAVTIAELEHGLRRDGQDRDARSSRRSGRRRRRTSGSGPAPTRSRSRPRSSCCPPRSSWRRTARSPTPAASSSGETPPSSLPERPSPTARSWTTSSGACATSSTTRGSPGTTPSRRPSGPTSRPRTSSRR